MILYIHTHTYTHTYIYTHIYINTHTYIHTLGRKAEVLIVMNRSMTQLGLSTGRTKKKTSY